MGRKPEATLCMLIEQNGKKRYVRVVKAANGRIAPRVRGTFLPGCFYLRYTIGGKRRWESVGADLTTALQEQKARQAALDQRLSPMPLDPSTPSRKTFSECAAKFLEEKSGESRTERTSAQKWKWLLNLFSSWWDKVYVDEFTREDFLAFRAYLKSRDLSPRTQRNNLSSLLTFLRASGWVVFVAKNQQAATLLSKTLVVKTTLILMKGDFPKVNEGKVKPYTVEQTNALLSAAENLWERLFLNIFICTGFREAEVSHLYWTDVNFEAEEISTTEKTDWDWMTKSSMDRTVDMPPQLVKVLQEAFALRKNNGLIFPNEEHRPEGHFLDALQLIAQRAKITCGVCNDCKTKKGRNCTAYGLHEFRKTYATRLSQAGVPIQDIKEALGHKDVSTTLLYLGVSPRDRRRENVRKAFPEKVTLQVIQKTA